MQSEDADQAPSPWRPLVWVIPLTLFLLGIAAAVGVFVGQGEREQAREEEVSTIIQEQFALGLLDLEQERWEVAKQRFEYIIQLDPGFPEAPERLAQALLGLSAPLPTATSPPMTPTPNLAPVQDILDQAQTAFDGGDWDASINHLLALRAKDGEFKPVAVDGLMYAALRNRGIRRISTDKLLEEGIYDLSLAESFAPLDQDATNWRSWAQLYLTANSFFGLNWEQASFYFEVVYNVAPGIRNDVAWKYAFSTATYAMLLSDSGDPCAAVDLLELSLLVLQNEDLEPTATAVHEACEQATAPPPPPPPTVTPDGTGTPAAEPTPTPTPEG